MPVDADILKLVADFRKIPPDLKRELRPALRKAAQPVLAEARARASWSTRIPGATSIGTGLTARRVGVSIRVSARKAPHARPYEHGGRQGTFRHPVFPDPTRTRGEWNWVAQRARPFLRPALWSKADEVAGELDGLVPSIARRHGWRGP